MYSYQKPMACGANTEKKNPEINTLTAHCMCAQPGRNGEPRSRTTTADQLLDYVTADKSTNHRVTNQVTVMLNAHEVYTNSDGTSGTGEALARSIYSDLEKNAGLKGKSLLQVQGRIMDGQYINAPFIDCMNEPVLQLL